MLFHPFRYIELLGRYATLPDQRWLSLVEAVNPLPESCAYPAHQLTEERNKVDATEKTEEEKAAKAK